MRIIGVIVSFVLLSCTLKSVDSIKELESYVNDDDHGLRKVEKIDKYKVEIVYRPTDLMVAKEANGTEHLNESQVQRFRKKYEPYTYFIVKLSRDNKEALHNITGDREQYSELVQTLSFKMREFVTLTTNAGDTIEVADFVLNRTFGLSASTDLLFAFNNEKAQNEKWIQFNLNEFGMGIGNLRFRFDTEDITNIPILNRENLKFTN